MLKLTTHQQPPQSVWLMAKVKVGSTPDNDLVLDAPDVSAFHAEFCTEDNQVTLRDNASETGTFLNGRRIDEPSAVKVGDIVTIGGVQLNVETTASQVAEADSVVAHNVLTADQWMLQATTSWLKEQRFPIFDEAILGRDSQCDIAIAGTHLSRRHAQLTVQGNVLHVKDLGSTNGTFVNGKRITEADVLPGDEIRFDVLCFLVVGPYYDADQTYTRNIVAKDVGIEIDMSPAVRVGEAKPTCVGNRDDMVEEYNQALAKMIAQEKLATSKGILFFVVVLVILVGMIYMVLDWA